MKLSRIRRRIADWLNPRPGVSRATHTAYSEQVHVGDGTYDGRVYDYVTGRLLEVFGGAGDRAAAGKHAAKVLRKYRRAG